MALGSGNMFTDKYIDKENNNKLRDAFINFLTSTETITLNLNESDDIDVSEFVSLC